MLSEKNLQIRHNDDKIHYFVGAGNQYGATYSYAMCYWEEQHWIRTKSIHSAEFFHGMLEIIDKDTPVTVFIGEDSQRSLSERSWQTSCHAFVENTILLIPRNLN